MISSSTPASFLILSCSLCVSHTSYTGSRWSTACVSRTARWGLTALDCSPLTESLWCVFRHVFSPFLLNVLSNYFWEKCNIHGQAELSAKFSSFFFFFLKNFNPALAVRRARDERVRSGGRGGAALPGPDVPARLLHFWELLRCQGEVQVPEP